MRTKFAKYARFNRTIEKRIGVERLVFVLEFIGQIKNTHAFNLAIAGVILSLVMMVSTNVRAQIILPVMQDTFIDNSSQNNNFGNNQNLRLRYTSGPTVVQAVLLKFDLAMLPPNTTSADVLGANLKLYVNNVNNPVVSQNIFNLCSAWDELTVTYNTPPTNCAPNLSSSTPIALAGQFVSIDVTDFVKNWAAGGANHGIRIQPIVPGGNVRFDSREIGGNPPVLEVTLRIKSLTGNNGLTGGGTYGDLTLGILDGGVTTPKIADGTVTSSKIANGAVGNAQLGINYAGSSSQGGPATSSLIANDAQNLGGIAPSGFAPSSGSPNYVAKSGDTMTGTLNLPGNGLNVGGNQFAISGGNVGIGTAAPSFKLDVAGSFRASSIDLAGGTINTADGSLRLQSTTTQQGTTGGFLDLGPGNFYYPGGSVTLGAGTTSPSYDSAVGPFIRLSGNNYLDGGEVLIASGHAYGAAAGGDITLNTSSAYGGNYPPPGRISLKIGGVEHFRVNNDGRVGIGSTSPAEALDVIGNIKASGNLIASSFIGSGAGLTSVSASALNCSACITNSHINFNYAGSASQGGSANSALTSNDSQKLGGILPSGFAPASGSANYAPASGSPNYAPASGSPNYVSKTGTESISGNKTFTSLQQFTGGVGIGQHSPQANELLSVGGNTGAIAGVFSNASNSTNPALMVTHAGLGTAIHGQNFQANGRGGFFELMSSLGGVALESKSVGAGPAFKATNTTGGTAGLFDGNVTINGGLTVSGNLNSTQLSSAGTINTASNPVDWTKLKNVPISLLSGQFVNSVNGLSSDVSLVAGENVTISPSGNTLTIGISPPKFNPQQIALLRWYDANTTTNAFTVGSKPIGMAFDGASIWVANLQSDNVTRVRSSDGTVLGTYQVGTNPSGIAFDGTNVWVNNYGSGNVSKLRASDGLPLVTSSVGTQPFGIAFDGANIWVANSGSGSVTKLRANDGAPLGTYSIGGSPLSIAFDGTNIWVTNHGGNNVWKLRASDGALLGTYTVGSNAYGVAFDGTNVWVVNEGSNSVMKLRTSDGAILGTFAVGNVPRAIAFDGVNIWVANAYSFDVTKLRASDGALLGTYPVGSFPEALAFDGANIWVANGGSNNVMKR